jgi:cobalt-precorrin 5A hydrolase
MNENQTHPNSRNRHTKEKQIAFWAITPKGMCLADSLRRKIGQVSLFVPKMLQNDFSDVIVFDSFRIKLNQVFHEFDGHVFVMATGVVVRMISCLIRHKTVDPAVVVMDEGGNHCISLLSGHIGGANALAQKLAMLADANPVITTATDVNRMLAIDVLASENGMFIENPGAIKKINMCFLQRKTVWIYDPYCFFKKYLKQHDIIHAESVQEGLLNVDDKGNPMPGIIVDDRTGDMNEAVLLLRPATLTVGLGCNRHTKASEILNLFKTILQKEQLAITSVFQLASIDLKSNEIGMLEVSRKLNIPLRFYDSDTLKTVKNIQNPSEIVRHHIGVNSVCEAAAILSASQGKLIIPKQKSKNVTLAVARISFM